MLPPITSLTTATPVQWPGSLAPSSGPTSSNAFQELLTTSLQQLQGMTATTQTAVQNSLVGDDLSMVETFTAMRESDLALRLMMQVRNKLVDAYQELQNLRF